jgi:hypothetical protein
MSPFEPVRFQMTSFRKLFIPKHVIEHDLEVMARMWIAMKIQVPLGSEFCEAVERDHASMRRSA